MMCGSVCLLSFGYVHATDLSSVNELGHFGTSQNTLRVLEQDGPKRQLGEITGTLRALDEISGRVSIGGIGGTPAEFVLEANTPLTDHNLQISLADLHLGDQVTVYYNVDPRRVNSIKRL
jgi:hypothetical protein